MTYELVLHHSVTGDTTSVKFKVSKDVKRMFRDMHPSSHAYVQANRIQCVKFMGWHRVVLLNSDGLPVPTVFIGMIPKVIFERN